MEYSDIENIIGDFTWYFGKEFLISTDIGFFVWNDPDYGGDGTIRKFTPKTKKPYKEFSNIIGVPFGRDKGKHIIKNFIGNESITVLINEEWIK